VSLTVDVTRRMGGRDVGIAFTSEAAVTAIVGRSGAGKTSVLNMIAGLLRPDRGRIVVGGTCLFDASAGVDVPAAERRAGYVFQDRRLFPHLRVRANLLFGAHGSGRLDEVARLLDLAPLLDRWPRHLSGGEAQRVAIGRALLREPAFLLMDEPLAHLDRARGEEVLAMIARAGGMSGVPVIYVTHRIEEAERLEARVVAME